MKKKRILAFIIAAVMSASSVITVFAQDTPQANEEVVQKYSNNMLKSMVRLYAHNIADNYYYGIEDEELLFRALCRTIDDGKFTIDGAVEAMIEALGDEHAQFFSPEEYNSMREDVAGSFAGIGVNITQTNEGTQVVSVIDLAPAMRAGIKAGDYIVAINGASTQGLTLNQVRNLVVGEIGSTVKVTLLRNGQTLEVECVREKIEVNHTQTRMIDGNIAYLKLEQFSQNAPEDVKKYLSEIQKKGIKKLIIDVRNNPGGDINAAQEIAEIFLSAGRIAELRYKDETANTYLSSKNYNAPRMKIALLVNENSASASELLASAFKSRGAAKIIGTTTYGKGSMQALMSLPTGAGMKYTIGEFYSAKGERINTIGVKPDIEIKNTTKRIDESEFEEIDLEDINNEEQKGKMNLALEERLEALGIFYEKPDEIYDDNTKEAVIDLQNALGYEATGTPGFYEYLYLKDLSYDFDAVVDLQLEEAVKYLS